MTFPSYFIQNYYENEILNVVTKQSFRTESYGISTSTQYLKISRTQHCERSELRLHIEWAKVNLKMPKMDNFSEFFEN